MTRPLVVVPLFIHRKAASPLMFALVLLACSAIQVPRLLAQQTGLLPASRTQMVTVEKDIHVEVVDWGGTGRSLILLQGLGGVAHDYDQFAPQFTAHNHVYGITRRGFGDSSKPATSAANYSAERLGKDVLAVIESLKLNRPVLAGQSIAGEEMSWIGTFHPEIVSGLIYLEAVDSYSFYDPAQTDMVMDMVDVRHEIDAFQASEPLSPAVLEAIRDKAAALAKSAGRMADNVAASGGQGDPALPPVGLAIKFGQERFTAVHAPMLAVVACPHDYSELERRDAKAAMILKSKDLARCTDQIKSLKAQNASAQVVVVPNADHQIVRTHADEAVRVMREFLAKFP